MQRPTYTAGLFCVASMFFAACGTVEPKQAKDLLRDPEAISTYAEELRAAVKQSSLDWLAGQTVGPESFAGKPANLPGLRDAEQQVERRKSGWTYWCTMYNQYGHFDLLRSYSDDAGTHLIYRAFDGRRPVYTDLLLGQHSDHLVLRDWSEQPGAMSEVERQEAFSKLAGQIGMDALRQTISTLLAAAQSAQQGDAPSALQQIDALPVEWRSNPLVAGDRLRILADAGHPDFPASVLRDGGLLSAPAVAHLAFSWSLQAGDAEGLSRATADLREQFGEDSLLLLYEGLAAEWRGDCALALQKLEAVAKQYPRNPMLPVYTLSCWSKEDPLRALERLKTLLPGTGFQLDELDAWIAREVPALYRSHAYHDWRLTAPAQF